MSPIKGKKKRKDNNDSESSVPESKRPKTSDVLVSSNSSNDADDISPKHNKPVENGVHDENSVEIVSENTNGLEHSSDVQVKSVSEEEHLQSFHAKFTKSDSTAQNVVCDKKMPACFACKVKDNSVQKCSFACCDKYYHAKCLAKLPTSKLESSACPLHLCLSCYNQNPKSAVISKGPMYKCFKCPTAFHAKDECTIPGSVILTHEVMSCPDHFSPEKLREYEAVMNLLFCVECGCNMDLIFCAFCPYSVHQRCIREGKFIGDKFVCERCESRKTLSYNDIVWAKIGNFRWWPARIINPKNVPSDVQKIIHFEGEFPVKFFETAEYFWTQKGRVYPFFFKNIGFEDADICHNFKKQMQDVVFESAVNLARQAVKDKTLMQQLDSTSSKRPPPYKHIKVNRPIGNVQIYSNPEEKFDSACGCGPEDPDPCGYNTLCLNRNMCQECDPQTCEAGVACQNQKFQKREYASVKPFCTKDRGWGLKCLKEIKAGTFVIEYIGDLIDEEECERRIQEKNAIGDNNFYFCTLDTNRIIDAGPKGNLSRFLNHSCDPNCETQRWIVNGDARVGIFAKKDIPVGAELTFDYQMDFSHNKKLQCRCGAARCSGLIGKKPQNGAVSRPAVVKVKGLAVSATKPDVERNSKGKPVCFKCKKGGKMMLCSEKSCKKSYHLRCVTNGSKFKQGSKNWKCSLHFCRKCEAPMEFQCFACPNGYCKKHADSSSCKKGKFACSKHQKVV